MFTPTDNTRPRARRGARRWQAGLLLAVTAALTVPTFAAAQDDHVATVAAGEMPYTDGGYVTTTSAPGRSLDVSAFSPSCVGEVPYVSYAIVPVGFTSSGPATLTFVDRDGNSVEQRTVDNLSGRTIYPGATADESGNGTDWPGWKIADDGVSWIPDPSDASLREGLTVVVEVSDVTATATVGYPAADSGCANPPGSTPPTTTICEPGEPGCTPTTTVCVPGQNNDGTPEDDCDLARTGGGPGNTLVLGVAVLLGGLLFLAAARRRTSGPARS